MKQEEQLMEIDDTIKNKIRYKNPEYLYGYEMEDEIVNTIFDEWRRWKFPNGVFDKLEDHSLYLVWYECKDSSDPQNSSETMIVDYIEKVPDELKDLKKIVNDTIINMREYKKARQTKLSI